ncbi:MAG TPA: saccharopine dehydrogenase C-terminal domain-containing protein [Flavobacterium sp.]|nr:saccharopine dehydrogenase C-terminal domain-containing protein [Flavobacterium sp.]
MKTITVIGAGRSSSSLIKYLLEHSSEHQFQVVVADQSLETAQQKVNNHPNGKTVQFSLDQEEARQKLVQQSDVVISMLPAFLHLELAKDCLKYNKHLVTASYISPEMNALNEEVKAKGLVFMNECGLDPGLDHMSAMKTLNEIRARGGNPVHFESFCGGLVAPESDDNVWNYKFSWNPRNVVVAGQGSAAKFLQQGRYKYIPYQRVFKRTEFLKIEGYGRFEAYANRDSLSYREAYGLQNAHTIYRGTIRRVGYSRAWNMLVQLGITDDTYTIENSENMTYREFINSFLYYHPTDSVEVKFRLTLNIEQDDTVWDKFLELELFNDQKTVGLKNASPARILEKILSEKWQLQPEDKDMIVMYHKFGYEIPGVDQTQQIDATMVCIGEDSIHTAMAKTVGLPAAIVALQILNGTITSPGVQMPVRKQVYEPVLKELASFGIVFNEKEVSYDGGM